eukprot:TRINITY_DN29561_c0_g1_i1.p1 TRINITY_DN29561_c0_g1~~TRINITY_DN29561_c0_g1_i1.p1  ORF type:complete len:343 (+),score=23.94 TRINITY_DN29561_c0_g1_i1:67-1095(+)
MSASLFRGILRRGFASSTACWLAACAACFAAGLIVGSTSQGAKPVESLPASQAQPPVINQVSLFGSTGVNLVRALGTLSAGDQHLRAAASAARFVGGSAEEPLAERRARNERQIWAIATLQSGGLVQLNRRIKTVELGMAAIARGIQGDFVETGTYTGGTAVLMCTILKRFSPPGERNWWGADSFQGLPSIVPQDQRLAVEGGASQAKSSHTGQAGEFRATEATLVNNLKMHGVYDMPGAKVHILKGWFNETLPVAPIKVISYLRLDGDVYVSTIEALKYLYPKLTVGGFIYVDDYGSFTGCRNAVDEYRKEHGITTPMITIPEDSTCQYEAIWWQKSETTG